MASVRINLADPDFEPTDEQLQQLSREAFADVPRKNAEAAARMTAAIAERRKLVVARIALRLAARARLTR